MTRRDTWAQRPVVLKYRAFCDALREQVKEQDFTLPEAGFNLWYHIPMPKTWSKKKKAAMRGQPHQQTPDVDNITKGVFDALLGQDSGIWDVRSGKFWAEEGRIEIEVTEDRPFVCSVCGFVHTSSSGC